MKGYILKFYRKVNSISTIKNGEMFFSWLNFDFFEQIEVSEFSAFYEASLDLQDTNYKNLNHYRQKMYVCGKNEKNIFSREQHCRFPIISMSMVKLGVNWNVADLKKAIEEKIEGKGIIEIFETLSDYDSVFILRTDSLECTLRVLSNLYLVNNQDKLKEMYTVASTDITKIENMSDDDCIKASIRLEYPFDMEGFKEETYQHYYTFGRSDGVIEYGPVSTREFVRMFVEKKLFENEKNVCSTDITIEMKTDEVQNSVDYRDFKTITQQRNEIQTKYTTLLKSISDSNYSGMLKTMLVRTVLRVTQSRIADYSCSISKYLQNLIYSVVESVLACDELDDYSQSITEMIQSFNLLMDNCVSSNQYNFEFPNNNLRSTGTMVRLLCAYNGLLKDIQRVLGVFRRITVKRDTQGSEPMEVDFFIWCVNEMQAMVSAKQLFVEPKNKLRFMVFSMTPEVMLKPRYAIPYLYHESGHFFRAGWERSARNKSLRECATYMFLYCWTSLEDTFSTYQMETFTRYMNVNSINMADIYAQDPADITNASYEHGEQQLKMIIRFYDNLISDIYDGKLQGIAPLKTPKWEMKERMNYCLNEMYSSYLESVADVFMIRALGVKTIEDYLPIVSEYLEFHSVKQANVGLGIIIRVTAICVLMDVLENECRGNIQPQNIYQKIIDVQAKIQSAKCISNYIFNESDYFDYASCVVALYDFLKNHVWVSMEEVVNSVEGNEIRVHFEEIEKMFSEIVKPGDDMESGFDFVREYMKKI